MLERLVGKGFEIHEESHAGAILECDFPDALNEIEQTLVTFEVPITEIIGSGGGETKGTQRIRKALYGLRWPKVNFVIRKTINEVERESVSHEVDHVRTFADGSKVALEIEWNNKDPFFDRDLENFKRLHAERVISIGVVLTRGTSLHAGMRGFVRQFAEQNGLRSFEDLERIGLKRPTARQRNEINALIKRGAHDFASAWAHKFVADKYGEATTHWRKLMDRVSRGVGHPCPLLLIGLPASIVTFEDVEVTTSSDSEAESNEVETLF